MCMSASIPDYDTVRTALKGVNLVRVRADGPTSVYILGDNRLEDLLDFIRMEGISTAFAEPTYIDASSLAIGPELLDTVPSELRPGVQLDAHRFNRELGSMDLSSPVELRVFVLYGGKAFGVRYTDGELDAFRRFSAADRLEAFVRERSSKVPGNRTMDGLSTQREDPGVERFVELLIKDPEYRRMPNDDERFNYVVKVARRPGNDALREGISREGGKGFSTEKVRRVVALSVKRMDLSRSEPRQMVFDRD